MRRTGDDAGGVSGHDHDQDTEPSSDEGQSGGTRQTIERITATISGVADGIVEGLERYHPVDSAQEVLAQSGELIRGTTQEAQNQLRSPEAQELRGDARHAAQGVRVKVQDRQEAMRQRMESGQSAISERLEHGQERVRERMHDAQEGLHRVSVTVQDKASSVRNSAAAVRETGRRSKVASHSIGQRLGHALSARMQGMGMAVGGYATAGLVGGIALVLLSIGSVVGFNLLLGTPWGYFITAGIYGLVAVAAAAGGKSGANKKREESREQVAASRRTARGVIDPIRHPTRFEPSGRDAQHHTEYSGETRPLATTAVQE